MQQALSKFFVIKSVIYVIAFSLLWYGLYTRKESPKPTVVPEITQHQWSWMQEGKACFNDRCLQVEIATTPSQREYGLMNRTSLELDKGMLFVFETEAIHTFWMKNTLIPLDMIWIKKDWTVVDIQTAQPCKTDSCPSSTPSWSGLYVLETNAGIANLIWLHSWSQIILKI